MRRALASASLTSDCAFALRFGEHLLGFGAGLVDGLVGGLLGEDEGALDDVGVHAGGTSLRGGGRRRCDGGGGAGRRRGRCLRGAGLRGADLLFEVSIVAAAALEELVDVVAVIAAPRFADLDVAQLLGGDIHGSHRGQC